ncbi:MAG: putative heme degradation protein [Flavobacteriales bacterium]
MVSNVLPLDNWLKVMDKEFNLHLNMKDVSQV